MILDILVIWMLDILVMLIFDTLVIWILDNTIQWIHWLYPYCGYIGNMDTLAICMLDTG